MEEAGQKVGRGEDREALVGPEPQEMLVTGDDARDTGGVRRGHGVIVVRILLD